MGRNIPIATPVFFRESEEAARQIISRVGLVSSTHTARHLLYYSDCLFVIEGMVAGPVSKHQYLLLSNRSVLWDGDPWILKGGQR